MHYNPPSLRHNIRLQRANNVLRGEKIRYHWNRDRLARQDAPGRGAAMTVAENARIEYAQRTAWGFDRDKRAHATRPLSRGV